MRKIFGILIGMLLIGIFSPITSGTENWILEQNLMPSDSSEADWFGDPVSLYGNTALIANGKGSAYVFTRTGTTWTQQAKLVSETDYGLSDSVSISGDTALLSSSGEVVNDIISGNAFVFTRTGNTWTQQARIVPSDAQDYMEFGCSVSIDGNTALIGAYLDDDNGKDSGSAYIFTRTGNIWTQQAKLLASDGEPYDSFGQCVSISGDTALIGSPDDYENGEMTGSAYIFTRTGTTWTQQAKLIASDDTTEDYFGISVSISGETALIGTVVGESAYVFTRTGNTWTQQQKLTSLDNVEEDGFGWSVSISGENALIGTRNGESAYVFTRTGNTWTQQQKLTGPESEFWVSRKFGYAVALYDETALIGAYFDQAPNDPLSYTNGSVYVFTKGSGDEPPADENNLPIASFTWTPSNPTVNQQVNFDASTSSDSDGSITKYEWDWNNDGTYDDTKTTNTVTHSWTQAGSYSVKLQVTDNEGATNTKTLTISISSESSGGNGGTEDKETPGFELILVILAIGMILFLNRKRKNNS